MTRRAPTTFRRDEMALAAGLSLDALKYLAGIRLVAARGGLAELQRVAAVGGLVAGGAPLVLAARIVDAVLGEFDAGANIAVRAAALPSGYRPATADEFAAHGALVRAAADGVTTYRAEDALVGDELLEIVDRRLALLARIYPKDGALLPIDVNALARLEWSSTGTNARAVPVFSEVQPLGEGSTFADGQAFYRHVIALDDEFARARQNATARLVVNMSLAYRLAIARIAEHRAARPRKGRAK